MLFGVTLREPIAPNIVSDPAEMTNSQLPQTPAQPPFETWLGYVLTTPAFATDWLHTDPEPLTWLDIGKRTEAA